ncbi:MAG: SDR family NAD(P)-dependent oxidoreductase [Firmicutes bacterium]|nr:SDR family NAD(P)-dependent oxidoreductase [Bacillota bacterium]
MKNILVTGAGGGMGSATCRLLIEKGYNVWGLDRRQKDNIDRLHFIQTDITDESAVSAAFEQVAGQTDRLDAVIHMAGLYDLNSLIEMSEQEFINIFNVNLFGVYRINRIFMPLIKDGSRIIITSSELAPLDPLPFTGIYAVTKAALEKYAFSLRMELNLLGVSVSVIRPGAVKTDLLSVSTRALDSFCKKTQLYQCNAKRFKKIVDSVEAKNIPAQSIAKIAYKAMTARRPKYVYSVNRNPLLRLLNILPDRIQVAIIKMILK